MGYRILQTLYERVSAFVRRSSRVDGIRLDCLFCVDGTRIPIAPAAQRRGFTGQRNVCKHYNQSNFRKMKITNNESTIEIARMMPNTPAAEPPGKGTFIP
jgi:hypothetical protein